jgi:hypothetical protein
LVRPSIIGPHNEILQRGEVRGCEMMSKTGYVEIASRLVTVIRSLLKNGALWSEMKPFSGKTELLTIAIYGQLRVC